MLIEHANAIIGDYQASDFVLTLRQLFYQLVSRSLIANKQVEHKKLGVTAASRRELQVRPGSLRSRPQVRCLAKPLRASPATTMTTPGLSRRPPSKRKPAAAGAAWLSGARKR